MGKLKGKDFLSKILKQKNSSILLPNLALAKTMGPDHQITEMVKHKLKHSQENGQSLDPVPLKL